MIDQPCYRWWVPRRRFGSFLAPGFVPFTITGVSDEDAGHPATNIQLIGSPHRTWKTTGVPTPTADITFAAGADLISGIYLSHGNLDSVLFLATTRAGGSFNKSWTVPVDPRTNVRRFYAPITAPQLASATLVLNTFENDAEVGTIAFVYAPLWFTEAAPLRPVHYVRREGESTLPFLSGGTEVSLVGDAFLDVFVSLVAPREVADFYTIIGQRELRAFSQTMAIDTLAVWAEQIAPDAASTTTTTSAYLVRRTDPDALDDTFAMVTRPTFTLREVA